jgi:predicted Kef-type K+ transport protein
MSHLDLILTLTGGLVAALALGYLTHRLGLSPIVGYLLGGIAVGPHTPGFVANRVLAEQLAEIGVILRTLGATPEQIDRERDRVHAGLFARPTQDSRHAHRM